MLTGRSFRLKLVLSYVLVVFLSFGLVAFFLDRSLEELSLKELQISLLNQASLIQRQMESDKLKADNSAYLQGLVNDMGARISCRITLVDKQGVVLADSRETGEQVLRMENHHYRPEIKAALAGQSGKDIRYSETLKVDMFYVAIPLKDQSGIIAALRLALPLVSVQKELFTVRKTIIFGTGFALLLALMLAWIVSRLISQPINRIIQASNNFSKGDFSRRIMYSSKDEIGELATTLNKMASDIEAKIKEVTWQNQHLSAILNSMIEGVIVIDKGARIVSLNPTIEKIFGVSCKDAENKLFLEAVRNNDLSEVVNDVLQSARHISRELTLVWPVQRIFEVNATPIFEKTQVNGCLVVIHDITQIRKLETMRRDFVANVSHELKTPLTSIKGFVETLLEGAMDDQEHGRQFLKIIQNHSDRLNSLINDLLDLSSMESRDISLRKEDFDLKELVQEVVSGFTSQFKKKNIEISNGLPVSLIVRADRNRVEQVITNLLDNALKFNKDGGSIKIYADDIQNVLKVFVEDTGIGIPAKDIPRIFERFYRVDKARSREMGGTGLGLSIVKHIAELHGGSVGVESIEGLGSKFWFTIPGGRK